MPAGSSRAALLRSAGVTTTSAARATLLRAVLTAAPSTTCPHTRAKINHVGLLTHRALLAAPALSKPRFPHVSAVHAAVPVPPEAVVSPLNRDCTSVDNGIGNLFVGTLEDSRTGSARYSKLIGRPGVIHPFMINQTQRFILIEQKHHLAEVRRWYPDRPE